MKKAIERLKLSSETQGAHASGPSLLESIKHVDDQIQAASPESLPAILEGSIPIGTYAASLGHVSGAVYILQLPPPLKLVHAWQPKVLWHPFHWKPKFHTVHHTPFTLL